MKIVINKCYGGFGLCSCGSTMGMPWCGTDGCVCRDVLNHGEDAYAAGADFSGCAR